MRLRVVYTTGNYTVEYWMLLHTYVSTDTYVDKNYVQNLNMR